MARAPDPEQPEPRHAKAVVDRGAGKSGAACRSAFFIRTYPDRRSVLLAHEPIDAQPSGAVQEQEQHAAENGEVLEEIVALTVDWVGAGCIGQLAHGVFLRFCS